MRRNLKENLKRHFCDVILCALAGTGLAINVFAGYDMRDPLSANIPAIALCILFTSAVLAAAHEKGPGLSIPVTAAVLFALCTVLYRTGTFSVVRPIDGNPALFWIVVSAVSVVVFWTARSRAGLVVLFLAGTFMAAAFELLEYPVSLPGYLLFLACVFALFLYRVNTFPVPRAKRKDGGSSSGDGAVMGAQVFLVQAVTVSLVALLLASAVYYGAIRPLAPPADTAKLAKKLMTMQFFEDAGIASKKVIIADKPKDPEQEKQTKAEEYQKKQSVPETQKKQNAQYGGGRLGEHGDLISVLMVTYKRNSGKIWISIAALLLLCAFAFGTRLFLRKKWYGDLRKKTREDGAMELYLYFVRKLKKAGFQKPEGLTLLEYVSDSKEKLDRFSVYDADFLSLTKIYLKMIYGYQRISEKEYELFHDFYREFHKNLRTEMGNVRYCLRSLAG